MRRARSLPPFARARSARPRASRGSRQAPSQPCSPMSDAPAPLERPAAAPFDAAAFQAATGAGPAAMADLETFRARLAEWNARMNLVGPSSARRFLAAPRLRQRPAAALAPAARRWVDIGAGAGFPGIVLAILLKDRPGAFVHLVESMIKRCRFLDAMVAELQLPATVHNARAEDLGLTADVVVARACAPLVRLFGYARPYLAARRGRAVHEGTRCCVRAGGRYNILAFQG